MMRRSRAGDDADLRHTSNRVTPPRSVGLAGTQSIPPLPGAP
jgi:hypothetical protein